ncbi:MAG: bifunctional 4-hydroxy-2-oxoglutarate aldolase/2-dehydro-3-deoxy-phosphogluconate aldolase [Propionibacteriaceae bacterium]
MSEFLERLRAERLVAIVRATEADDAVRVGRALLACGVHLVEVTLTTRDALTAIETLRMDAPDPAMIGAGTVLTKRQAHDAVDAGAQFLVTPAVTEAIEGAEVPVLAGAYTASEAYAAMAAGATAVKLFPASAGGPAYLKALRDPFPTIPFVPVGGVSLDQVAPYLIAGAIALGVGGPIMGDAVRGGSLDALAMRAKAFLEAIAEAS